VVKSRNRLCGGAMFEFFAIYFFKEHIFKITLYLKILESSWEKCNLLTKKYRHLWHLLVTLAGRCNFSVSVTLFLLSNVDGMMKSLFFTR
jgi:hypothetical protein